MPGKKKKNGGRDSFTEADPDPWGLKRMEKSELLDSYQAKLRAAQTGISCFALVRLILNKPARVGERIGRFMNSPD